MSNSALGNALSQTTPPHSPFSGTRFGGILHAVSLAGEGLSFIITKSGMSRLAMSPVAMGHQAIATCNMLTFTMCHCTMSELAMLVYCFCKEVAAPHYCSAVTAATGRVPQCWPPVIRDDKMMLLGQFQSFPEAHPRAQKFVRLAGLHNHSTRQASPILLDQETVHADCPPAQWQFGGTFFSGKILIFSRASYTPLLKTAAQQTKSASGNQEGGKIS